MAISFEQMPEANRQRALEIFGQQQRGEITAAQAQQLARQNEQAAQDALRAARPDRPGGSASAKQDCPPGYIWDQAKNACVVDPNAYQNLPAFEATLNPKNDPSRKPNDAPEGYDYEWNGTEWVLVRDTDSQNDFLQQQARESAMDLMRRRLDAYGLGNLAQFVWNLITQENITSEFALVERIRETDQYKQRFPAMQIRRNRNLNAISEQDYINLENSYRETMKIAGMPVNLFDTPEDFTSLIAGDVSPSELKMRVNQGYAAVAQSDPQVIREMKRLYGVDDSMLAAYFLDPERTTPMLLRQAQAAQIAGEATLQAEMGITAATAEQLAVAGVTQETARQGFQTIAATEELFVPLPGTTEQAIAQEEQIAGVFGTSGAAQQRIRQRSRERQAAFQAGGQFAGQGTTVTGLQ